MDGDERCGELQWFWRRLGWSRLEWQPPPRARMMAGGDIPSGGKMVGASTSGASANGAVIGGASIIGTGTPAITATAPTARRPIIRRHPIIRRAAAGTRTTGAITRAEWGLPKGLSSVKWRALTPSIVFAFEADRAGTT